MGAHNKRHPLIFLINAMSDNDQLQQIASAPVNTKGGLRRRDLPTEPLTLFERWRAKRATPGWPIRRQWSATVDDKGQPLPAYCIAQALYDEKRHGLYTSTGSRKAHQIEHNPRLSACYFLAWQRTPVMVTEQKQSNLSTHEVVGYFHSKSRGNRIGAWVSKQSSRISARYPRKQIHGAPAEVSTGRSAVATAGVVFRVVISFRWSSGRAANIVCDRFIPTRRRRMENRPSCLRPKDAKILF